MDIKNLRRNSAAIEGGTWIDQIPAMGDMRLKVRGLASTAYTRAIDNLKRAIEPSAYEPDGTVKHEPWDNLLAKALCEAVLIDWDGLESNGKSLPYSKAQALTWLSDPDFRDFRNAVLYAAAKVDKLRAHETEDVQKK